MKIAVLIMLFIVLLLGSVLNYLPHLAYQYPLHVDEWTHFTYAKHISHGSPLYFGGESSSLEHGFHILLAVLNLVGIDYIFMFRFFPAILTFILGLTIFVAVRKWFDDTSALFAVLFAMLIKGSVALLGPMFLVPLTIGLIMIFATFFLINSRLLFLIIASTLIMHPPSGVALLLFVNSYLLSQFVQNKTFRKDIVLQQFIGILLALPLFISQLLQKGIYNLSFRDSFVGLFFLPRYVGYIIFIAIAVGLYFMAYRKKYTLLYYPLSLAVLAFLYYQFSINILIFYERNIMYLLFFFSVPFGVAVSEVISRMKKLRFVFVFLIMLVALIILLPDKIDSTKPIYHIIDDKEYADFLSYKEITGNRAVLDPWKAIAFTPLAEKEIYSRIPPGPNDIFEVRNKEIGEFFKNDCIDKEFLTRNNIDIIYGC